MRRVLLALVAVAVLAVACTLPTDDEAKVLTGPEIENAMNPTTTSTTQPSGPPRDRDLFFFDDDDVLTATVEEIPFDASIADILNRLAPSDEELELRTAIPEGFVVSDTDLASNNTLVVVLADDTLFESAGGEQLLQAIAQIVVTATQLDDVDVDQVLFVVDGVTRQVPTGDGRNTDQPVNQCDYRTFLPDERCTVPLPTSTTTSSTTPVPGGG